MTETIPTNPAPTAVPWTPDMMTPDVPPRAPAQSAAALQPQMQPQVHPAPYQPAPQYQPAQAEFTHPAAQPMPRSLAQQPQVPPAQAPHAQAQIQAHPAPYTPAGQPQQFAHPQHAPVLQPVHHRQQPAPPQAVQAAAPPHMAGQPAYAPPQQPQYAQPGPPPPLHQARPPAHPQARPPVHPMAMAPQMQAATAQLEPPHAPEKSKSLITNLLKRSPRPGQSEAADLPAKSESMFNKNFILGALTGLVVGAFVVPMLLNIVGGGSPAQAQAAYQAETSTAFDPAPASTNGDTFIDNAIAADAP